PHAAVEVSCPRNRALRDAQGVVSRRHGGLVGSRSDTTDDASRYACRRPEPANEKHRARDGTHLVSNGPPGLLRKLQPSRAGIGIAACIAAKAENPRQRVREWARRRLFFTDFRGAGASRVVAPASGTFGGDSDPRVCGTTRPR